MAVATGDDSDVIVCVGMRRMCMSLLMIGQRVMIVMSLHGGRVGSS
jgi:hypothetical protein